MPTDVSLSFVANVVLTLFLGFQWWRSHAKEQSVKNGLFAVRSIVQRISGIRLAEVAQRAEDAVDALDGVLATLDARPPFSRKSRQTMDEVHEKFKNQKEKE